MIESVRCKCWFKTVCVDLSNGKVILCENFFRYWVGFSLCVFMARCSSVDLFVVYTRRQSTKEGFVLSINQMRRRDECGTTLLQRIISIEIYLSIYFTVYLPIHGKFQVHNHLPSYFAYPPSINHQLLIFVPIYLLVCLLLFISQSLFLCVSQSFTQQSIWHDVLHTVVYA